MSPDEADVQDAGMARAAAATKLSRASGGHAALVPMTTILSRRKPRSMVAGEVDLGEHHQGGDAKPDGDRELQHHQHGAQPRPSRLARLRWCAAPAAGRKPDSTRAG